jgi:hypothetical protein
VGKISRRDYVIQPSVAMTKEWLRWVVHHNLKPTLKELHPVAANIDATTLWLMIIGNVDPA